jgi:hypothetical protein
MRSWRACLSLAAVLALSACGPNSGVQSPTSAPPVAQQPATQTTVSPEAQAGVDAALQDAAAHLGIDKTELHVDDIQSREWGDASLGCPQPGILYSQIVTPGFLVLVSTGSKHLEYHADSRGHVVLCKES